MEKVTANEAKQKKEFQCNISENLWSAWKRLKRPGDSVRIAEKLNVSRPIIDRALNHGYVSMEGVLSGINKFFMDRRKQEDSQADQLTEGL